MPGTLPSTTSRWSTTSTAETCANLRNSLWGVTGAQRELIVRDPTICHGQAVVKGTRIMVSVILDALAAGMTEDEILREYPTLTINGIRAAAAYGAELARDEYPAVAGS